MKFEDGVHSISNEEYHSSGGISRSGLMLMQKSPYHYWYERISGDAEAKKETPALVMGDLVHTLCLEPYLYKERFAVGPDLKKTTKAGKEAWALFEKENLGKSIIKPDELAKAERMASSFRSDAVCSSIISDAVFEQSIYFTHKETGIQCKSRPDVWSGPIVGDLKTTDNASSYVFAGSAAKYGYFLQAGMMKQALESLGEEMQAFIFLCVEKDAPYAVGTYPISAEALEYGSNLFDELMLKLSVCLDSNHFPSYPAQELQLPNYLKESQS